MNEIFVTVNGVVDSDVKVFDGERSARATFRLVTAERFFDRERGEWVSREPVWIDIVCWRRLAEHVAASITKGDPVMVRGRLRVSRRDGEGRQRQGLEVLATSIGHDLAMGHGSFMGSLPPKAGVNDVA